MKKALLVLVVLFCALTVFAADNSVTFGFVPCSVEIKTSSYHTENSPLYSIYGIGANLEYQRYVLMKGLYVEAGIGWNTTLFKSGVAPESDLMFYAGAGYKAQIAPELSLFAHADIGEDTVFYKQNAQAAFVVKTGVGVALDIVGNFDLNLTVDGAFSFCKSNTSQFVDYRILPIVGVNYTF